MRIPKSVRNTVVSVVALLVILVGVGIAYTWYVGQQSGQSASVAPLPAKKYSAPFSAPPKPSAKTPASAAVRMATSPVAPGDNASITIKTNPVAKCEITVEYDPKDRTLVANQPPITVADSGLQPKTADEYGIVSWAWTFDETAPQGNWTAQATCGHHDQSAVVQGDIEVKR